MRMIIPPTSRPSGTITPSDAMHHASTPTARRHASANASAIGLGPALIQHRHGLVKRELKRAERRLPLQPLEARVVALDLLSDASQLLLHGERLRQLARAAREHLHQACFHVPRVRGTRAQVHVFVARVLHARGDRLHLAQRAEGDDGGVELRTRDAELDLRRPVLLLAAHDIHVGDEAAELRCRLAHLRHGVVQVGDLHARLPIADQHGARRIARYRAAERQRDVILHGGTRGPPLTRRRDVHHRARRHHFRTLVHQRWRGARRGNTGPVDRRANVRGIRRVRPSLARDDEKHESEYGGHGPDTGCHDALSHGCSSAYFMGWFAGSRRGPIRRRPAHHHSHTPCHVSFVPAVPRSLSVRRGGARRHSGCPARRPAGDRRYHDVGSGVRHALRSHRRPCGARHPASARDHELHDEWQRARSCSRCRRGPRVPTRSATSPAESAVSAPRRAAHDCSGTSSTSTAGESVPRAPAA